MAERQTWMTPRRDEARLPGRWTDVMDRLFDDFRMARPWRSSEISAGMQAWGPDVDVFTKNGELVIRADLPGMKREDVNVDVTEQAITIQGERKHEKEEQGEGYYRSERGYGSFARVVPLPEGAISNQAKASFRDGVLEITMPCPPASKGRRLEIAEKASK
jgi:HSP20 family protein